MTLQEPIARDALKKRCEYCDEILAGKVCPFCRQKANGYYPDPEKMPPKANKKAWVEIGKSISRMIELTRRHMEPKPKEKVLHTITCCICGREAEVTARMRSAKYPRCDSPECHVIYKRMTNTNCKRKKREKAKAKKPLAVIGAGRVTKVTRDKR